MWQLIAPRFAVNTAAAVAAYTLGTLAAWYETALLLGSPPAGAMLAGLLCGSVFLIFAVSVTTAAASVARSTLATVGITLGVLLALPILGIAGLLHAWLPSTLVTAPVALLGRSDLGDYPRPGHRGDWQRPAAGSGHRPAGTPGRVTSPPACQATQPTAPGAQGRPWPVPQDCLPPTGRRGRHGRGEATAAPSRTCSTRPGIGLIAGPIIDTYGTARRDRVRRAGRTS